MKIKLMSSSLSKEPNTPFTFEQIENDLFRLHDGFPTAAVEAAIAQQTEVTPRLLTWLNTAIDDVSRVQDTDIGHMFALFLLSQFREKNAFETIIRLARLPEDELDYLIDDCITDDLHRFMASTFNGDLAAIKHLIEDTEVNIWSRVAALESLVILVHEGQLVIDDIALYLTSLFTNKSVSSNDHFISYLVASCCDLDPHRFKDDIEKAFKQDKVDPLVIDQTMFKQILLSPTLQYNDGDSSLISDTIAEMDDWVCFKDPADCDEEEDDEILSQKWFENVSAPAAPAQVINNTAKTGRNDPCPCSSGKKYKKCCASPEQN